MPPTQVDSPPSAIGMFATAERAVMKSVSPVAIPIALLDLFICHVFRLIAFSRHGIAPLKKFLVQ